mmetsp:Transcript_37300/g.103792  ORF Transcript_37300/g.103792 Transcript_37300/m.103792 type:complete len:218 (+) Transcript_37300:273-926(+)
MQCWRLSAATRMCSTRTCSTRPQVRRAATVAQQRTLQARPTPIDPWCSSIDRRYASCGSPLGGRFPSATSTALRPETGKTQASRCRSGSRPSWARTTQSRAIQARHTASCTGSIARPLASCYAARATEGTTPRSCSSRPAGCKRDTFACAVASSRGCLSCCSIRCVCASGAPLSSPMAGTHQPRSSQWATSPATEEIASAWWSCSCTLGGCTRFART